MYERLSALDHLQSRIEETTISDVKQQLKQHLEETKAQQDKLKKKVRDIVKDTENRMTPEKELMRSKEDVIIENAEIISYKMLKQLAEKLNVKTQFQS